MKKHHPIVELYRAIIRSLQNSSVEKNLNQLLKLAKEAMMAGSTNSIGGIDLRVLAKAITAEGHCDGGNRAFLQLFLIEAFRDLTRLKDTSTAMRIFHDLEELVPVHYGPVITVKKISRHKTGEGAAILMNVSNLEEFSYFATNFSLRGRFLKGMILKPKSQCC